MTSAVTVIDISQTELWKDKYYVCHFNYDSDNHNGCSSVPMNDII